VINAAARLVLDLTPHDHVTPALLQLHWLSVKYRIRYQLFSGKGRGGDQG
jgi:hypothetical protein